MSVAGTGIEAAVAQTAQQAERVARRKDKKARDKRAQADSVELHALGQEKVEEVDQPEAAPAPEAVGVATDAERGDKPTDKPPAGPEGEAAPHGAAAADAAEVEAVSAAEAAASYEKTEPGREQSEDTAAPGKAVEPQRRPHVDLEA